jgi:predicted transcriptional regulator
MHVLAQELDPARTKVVDAMRTDVAKVNMEESVEHCLAVMKARQCRHLLVFDGPDFAGIVSLRDLVALMLEEKEELVSQLNHYITS